MISLMFALLAGPAAAPGSQAVSATLQSCAMEGGRWVCRYAVPDIEIVPVPDSNVVTDAPAAVLGAAPDAADAATGARVPSPSGPEPAAPTVDRGPVRTVDAGVLTEREARLVARCAEAGWMSLCLPDDRRAARSLRDAQTAYLAVRRDVTRRLGEDDCAAAVRAALDGGYLALARETRDYCAAPATTSASAEVASATGRRSGAAPVQAPARAAGD
jgi:hypothetical protein